MAVRPTAAIISSAAFPRISCPFPANILRTDAHMHRQLPADSDLVRSIAVLARAAQDAAWRRTRATQGLRSLLREYYPTFLDAFAGTVHTNLAKPEARAVLAIAPTPQQGAKLTRPRIIAALRRAAGSECSTRPPPESNTHCDAPSCVSPRSSNKQWVAKRSHCSPP